MCKICRAHLAVFEDKLFDCKAAQVYRIGAWRSKQQQISHVQIAYRPFTAHQHVLSTSWAEQSAQTLEETHQLAQEGYRQCY
jgi:hypothetical protein